MVVYMWPLATKGSWTLSDKFLHALIVFLHAFIILSDAPVIYATMHRRRNQGGTGGTCPPKFSVCSIYVLYYKVIYYILCSPIKKSFLRLCNAKKAFVISIDWEIILWEPATSSRLYTAQVQCCEVAGSLTDATICNPHFPSHTAQTMPCFTHTVWGN